MDAQELKKLADNLAANQDFITNEETTKQSLIVPFIRLLGFDPANPREVRLEYSGEFTAGDGKRLPDRMDFAIFDATGLKPRFVIEAKALGSDVEGKSPQLARYLSQLPGLRFGIITDGREYCFYGDLDEPNRMDSEPFFSFNLSDTKLDFDAVAAFLTNFSRDKFEAESLISEAEDSRYRQGMIDRLVYALREPNDDFVRWMADTVYKGPKTKSVMARLRGLAAEAIQPAIMRVINEDFLSKLRDQMLTAAQDFQGEVAPVEAKADEAPPGEDQPESPEEATPPKKETVTTDEEMKFFEKASNVLSHAGLTGVDPDKLCYKDTKNYFNVSYDRPTWWFLRFFGDSRKKNVVTLVPVETAKTLAPSFEVEAAPSVFGESRIFISSVDQLWALKDVLVESLKLLLASKDCGSPPA